MKYTVLYKPEVIHHIDRIWRESDDQEMIAEEIDNLGRMLGHDPNNLGESRENGRRIAFTENLGVRFRVIESELTVMVTTIWRIR